MATRSRRLARALCAATMVAGLAGTLPARAISPGTFPAKFDLDILSPESSPRAIVAFDHDVTDDTIRRLAAAGITKAVVLDTIDSVGVLGPVSAYLEIATWDDVRVVDSDSPLRFNNYSAKKDTKVYDVRKGKKPLESKYDGAGVTVAVIDTGIESIHPDLTDQVVKHVNFEPAWFFDMINDGSYSDQLAEATGNPIDSYGHGTHVAGIVAGTGESAMGVDMSGVAPGAKLVDFKIADVHQGVDCTVPCDIGWEMNALVAFEYMIEHRNDDVYPGGIRVANNSWSIFEVDSPWEPITMITRAAVKSNIVTLFAAGNDGPGKNTVAVGPNSLEEVITVAAACKSDGCGLGTIADFSSRGPQVDVAAPGAGIYSTRAWVSVDHLLGSQTPPPEPDDDPAAAANNAFFYVGLSGTSMATPHTAGVVALMLDANPKLKPAQVEKMLTSTATDFGPKGFDTDWGFGEINALKAVDRAEGAR